MCSRSGYLETTLREVIIKAKKGGRALLNRQEFYEREVSDGLKGCRPGEWVYVSDDPKASVGLLCLANPMSQRSAPLRVLCPMKKGESLTPEKYIENAIEKAMKKRALFGELSQGSRLIYGQADGLPGVIADSYQNACLLQINTAGMDAYRELIKSHIEKLSQKKCYFLDNKEYRESEGLPQYDVEEIPDLEVVENGVRYFVSSEKMQKIGYYYDHRTNRKKLISWLEHFKGDKKTGLDLFSYMGSWGLNALKGGVERMTFVDQGDFSTAIEKNLELNNFKEDGHFVRANVFDWIKSQKETYDVVISDPPAFSKSLKNKSKALGGYQKLHRNLSQIVHSGSLLAIGSCTHGVTLEELDLTVHQGFMDSNLSCQLLDLGHQGPDHPIETLNSSDHYIKFLLYLVN